MKKTTLLSLLALLFSSIAFADRVCVLVYERPDHPYSQAIEKIFAPAKAAGFAKVMIAATPEDFNGCVREGFTEIVVLVHHLSYDEEDTRRRNFAYFSRVSKEERGEEIQKALDELDHEWLHLPPSRNTHEIDRDAQRIQEKAADLERFREIQGDGYVPVPFVARPFQKALKFLKEEQAAGKPIPLKSIRIVGCNTSDVLETYPSLTSIMKDFGVSLDLAPSSMLWSFILGRPVSTLDEAWISESAQFQGLGRRDYFYSYLHFNTYLVYSEGEAYALQGKYRIKMKGLRLGLSSEWSKTFISYADVEGLEVGDKRSFSRISIDASMNAVILSAGLKINPVPQVKIPLLTESSANGVGVSLGLGESVSIERLY